MSNPVIANNKPVKVGLKKGLEYHFCTCGKSKSQPFCDGSHIGTSFTPRVIVSEVDDDDAYLCACKHTRSTPFCGSSGNCVLSELTDKNIACLSACCTLNALSHC